jgi:hypothetical protein
LLEPLIGRFLGRVLIDVRANRWHTSLLVSKPAAVAIDEFKSPVRLRDKAHSMDETDIGDAPGKLDVTP